MKRKIHRKTNIQRFYTPQGKYQTENTKSKVHKYFSNPKVFLWQQSQVSIQVLRPLSREGDLEEPPRISKFRSTLSTSEGHLKSQLHLKIKVPRYIFGVCLVLSSFDEFCKYKPESPLDYMVVAFHSAFPSAHFPQRGLNLKSCVLPISLQEPLKHL